MMIKALYVATAALALASAAQAQVAVQIWTGLPNGGAPSNATIAQASTLGTAERGRRRLVELISALIIRT